MVQHWRNGGTVFSLFSAHTVPSPEAQRRCTHVAHAACPLAHAASSPPPLVDSWTTVMQTGRPWPSCCLGFCKSTCFLQVSGPGRAPHALAAAASAATKQSAYLADTSDVRACASRRSCRSCCIASTDASADHACAMHATWTQSVQRTEKWIQGRTQQSVTLAHTTAQAYTSTAGKFAC